MGNSLLEAIHGVYGGILLLLLVGPLTVLWAVSGSLAWLCLRVHDWSESAAEWLEGKLL